MNARSHIASPARWRITSVRPWSNGATGGSVGVRPKDFMTSGRRGKNFRVGIGRYFIMRQIKNQS